MASTGAVLYVRPRATATESPGRRTNSVIYFSPRAASGLYTESGVTSSVNTRNKKISPPSIGDPVGHVTVGGQRLTVQFDDRFWRFIVQEIHERRLGGDQGLTLTDISSTVTTTQEQAATVAVSQAAVIQQVTQNAEALTTTVESVQAAALPGSAQIPQVQRTRQMEP